METRKQKEKEHADKLKKMLYRAKNAENAADNKKYYSITRSSLAFLDNWAKKRITPGKKFLDYCCGEGDICIRMARLGADITGIDISGVSIKFSRQKAKNRGFRQDNPRFLLMDSEKTSFPDNSFDVIFCTGVLHHLDLKKAYPEMARILKPGGQILCNEPLAYNPIFQLYRKKTPHLRTEWEAEHILTKESINMAKEYFGNVQIRFFHLADLAAVPFRHTPIFSPVLYFFDAIDWILLKLPFVKWWAWQTIFILSDPKK